IVKFVYIHDYWEVQLDGATGNVLQISQRRSDLIEDLHDGSFLDLYFNTKGEPIKLVYTLIMGTALLTFTITGFWLWYGPILIRKQKLKKGLVNE
ncbi:MAG: PepSY domain-containing protein, partial [Bacteroidota bacterium]